MCRFIAVLATVIATAAIVIPTGGATLTDDLIRSAIDDLVAWDPGFAPFAADAAPAGHEYVVGSQKVTVANGDFQHVRVSAHSLPGGVDPKGQVEVSFNSLAFGGAADLFGDVDCLNVGPGIGPPGQTEADVDAVLRQPYMGHTHVQLIIIDNGNPGPTMGMSPDLAFIGFTSSPPPSNCSNFGIRLFGDQSGNLVAHDVVE